MALIPATLEFDLYKAAYDGFIESFLESPAQDGDARTQQANAFAKTFAKAASIAIDKYIKSASITGGLVTTMGSMTTQAGPISVPPTIA